MTTVGDLLGPVLFFAFLVIVLPLIIIWLLERENIDLPRWIPFVGCAVIWGLFTGILPAIWNQKLF